MSGGALGPGVQASLDGMHAGQALPFAGSRPWLAAGRENGLLGQGHCVRWGSVRMLRRCQDVGRLLGQL
eukprot:8041789-Alexandrium_andersonii.AAC.1